MAFQRLLIQQEPSDARRRHNYFSTTKALRYHAGFLPACDAVDLILDINRAEKESHGTAHLQAHLLVPVVVLLHSGLDAEDTHQVNNHARKNEDASDWGQRVTGHNIRV